MGKFHDLFQAQYIQGTIDTFECSFSCYVQHISVIFLMSFNSRKNYGHTELHMDKQLVPQSLAGVNGPTDWNEALDIISFGSPEQVSNLSLCRCFFFFSGHS